MEMNLFLFLYEIPFGCEKKFSWHFFYTLLRNEQANQPEMDLFGPGQY